MPDVLLETDNLTKSFPVRTGFFGEKMLRLVAVDHVTVTVRRGETLGLVGESGCGKTTLGLTILRLYEPTSGGIVFDGQDLMKLDPAEMQRSRRKMQMIFQDPLASLDPRMVVEEIIREPMDIHGEGSNNERTQEVARLLQLTGMPTDAAMRFPTEFSGGQQQRIGIARALALQPQLMVCDEPVSALDVSVQAQILNLLKDLQEKHRLAYLFVSHNLGVVKYMAHRIAVMYMGQIVELTTTADLHRQPLNPYTRALLAAIPTIKRGSERPVQLQGEPPDPANPPSGCKFHPRCPMAQALCAEESPPLNEWRPHHFAACHFALEAYNEMSS
jgi:oligopeptide transport system ATP-binding protein